MRKGDIAGRSQVRKFMRKEDKLRRALGGKS